MQTLITERDRLVRHLSLILRRPSEELPLRICSDEVEGELGGLAWHPEFAGYLKDAGVCFCTGEHTCTSTTYRLERGKGFRRLRKAFRELRRISPEAYDACWLLIMHRVPYEVMASRLNDTRMRRGEPPYSPTDIALFVISGLDLLTTLW
jgi:hypothetical protein